MKKHILWILLVLCFSLSGCITNSSDTAEVETLTLAVFKSESQLARSGLAKWVNLYNENADIIIEIINYNETFYDPHEALEKIKIEIIAGRGPDMIDFGLDYSPLDASNGMMADLYPMMQNDPLFNKQDYYDNILESFAVGENLFVLVPTFRIRSFATVNSELTGLESVDIKKLKAAYNTLDDGSVLFPGETKSTVLGTILYGSLENYIDWNEGICQFNSLSFRELLHFANQFPLHLNFANDHSVKEFFTEGRALLYPVSIDNVYGTAQTKAIYGETPTYIGYPFDEGNGNMADIVNIAIGICATSKNKEAAWDFIRSLLDSEFQDNTKNGLPLRISSLEQMIFEAMEEEYDSNGTKTAKEQIRFEGEEAINIYAIDNEDAVTLRSIINKVRFNATVDYNLYNIILEETDYLFNDNRNIDDVADIIQNRASLYIQENR